MKISAVFFPNFLNVPTRKFQFANTSPSVSHMCGWQCIALGGRPLAQCRLNNFTADRSRERRQSETGCQLHAHVTRSALPDNQTVQQHTGARTEHSPQ